MIAQRAFADYNEYVHKQGVKARLYREKLLAHLEKNTESFTRIFCRASAYLLHGPILCLGARTGAESIGATRAGFPASVGIDLHPVGPTVLFGDWHSLPFADQTFSNVYTNSLDHCLYLDRLAAEVQRVLLPNGRFYLMATNRDGATVEGWQAKDINEALYWSSSDEIAERLCTFGFTITARWRTGKWGHYVFTVTP